MTDLDVSRARARATAMRDAVHLLAVLGRGAEAPVIVGDEARITCTVPEDFLDAYASWVTAYHAGGHVPAAAARDASGAWSGVLLPAQREAGRLVVDLFQGIAVAAPLPNGGYRLLLTCDLAQHDRLALCLAALPEVVALTAEAPESPPGRVAALPAAPVPDGAVVPVT